ncbi:OmpA family protein [Nonomuraea sp. NPDC050478]|uniref:OmpA family protein n=1 Tax=Nonomuraea sp. NPDC050478 TaxID=3364365 RepID=UPI003789D6CD
MFRSLSLALALTLASPTPPPESAIGVVEDLVLPVEDIIGEVESLDGSASESQRGDQVTVALTSDVLFALDKWRLTAKARQRLEEVAEQINTEGAGGQVRVEGHTDDQGADAYNDTLSQRRADAVKQVMAGLLTLPGVTLQAQGFGETRPKLPNTAEGKPLPKNRAKNRRVDIVYTIKQ